MKLTKAFIVGCALIGGASLAMGENDMNKAAQKVESGAKKAVQDGKTAFFDMIDKESVTVSFDKGSATLTEGEKTSLRAAVTAARGDAKLSRVVVAAWSDSDLPRNNDVKLSEQERDLAEKRADNIETFLETIEVGNVDTYSMAEHANWFERMFKTDEAQIKKSMKGMEINEETERTLAEKLTSKGGPSKAAVLIITENSYLSH